MKRSNRAGLVLSLVFATGLVHAAEVYKPREHRCEALQTQAREAGSITLKVFLGSLTLQHRVVDCKAGTHQVVSPGWRTADKRSCIIGSYCTILNHGHID
ncbi:MAG: hypothetical protein AAF460_02465 [Pseudomonadota bacterium]